jgi:hypothetical protein
MGEMTRLGYATLDALIAERGNEWLYGRVMDKLFEGERPSDIAAQIGVPWVVLRGWIEKHCPDDVALAGRARADELEWKATNAVDYAEPETVALARLKADHYMKVAAKLDRTKWGDKEANGGAGITVVVERGGVLRIGSDGESGTKSPDTENRVIEGELVSGDVV